MTSPIKQKRRTKREIEILKETMFELVGEEKPMTVRQVFYRMVSMGAIEKTETEYKNVVCRLLVELRKDGIIPYYWIADNTRWIRKPRTFSSIEHALKITAETYRKSLWNDVDCYVEIWLEKEALSGVIYEETQKWDVPLMVTRGYPSLSYIYSASNYISDLSCPIYIYYFGDHDPSGVDIPRVVYKGLKELSPESDIHFQISAVTPEQIFDMNLLTRPTKRSDSRAKNFIGESIEVDAIPPAELRTIVRSAIEKHISHYELEQIKLTEELEKETLHNILKYYDLS